VYAWIFVEHLCHHFFPSSYVTVVCIPLQLSDLFLLLAFHCKICTILRVHSLGRIPQIPGTGCSSWTFAHTRDEAGCSGFRDTHAWCAHRAACRLLVIRCCVSGCGSHVCFVVVARWMMRMNCNGLEMECREEGETKLGEGKISAM
jgi:hypothetical protein